MNEQEILSALKAHVARHQGFGPDDQRPAQLRMEASLFDVSNLSRLSAEVWSSRDAVGQLNPRNPGLLNELAQTVKKVMQRALNWYTRPLQVFHLNVARAIEEQGTAIGSIERSLRRVEDEMVKIRSEQPAKMRSRQTPDHEMLRESLKAAERAVQEQQSPYVELFHGLSPVLDIGCGYGEFLELLKANGTAAYGVDSDITACEIAGRKLLKIVNDDLFEHLKNLPDRSLGGIFAARVIEYLPRHLQMELVSLASHKLKQGGLVVIETINPDSTMGYGRNANLDPSHLRAVPPEVLKSALESNGFKDVTISYLAPTMESISELPANADAEHANRILSGVRKVLTRAQAYAAIGRC